MRASFFWKDMRYRKLRVGMTVAGVATLCMMILLFGGIMHGLRWQAHRYVESTGADVWISGERSGGVFVGFSLIRGELVVPATLAIGGAYIDQDVGAAPLVFAQARPIIRKRNLQHETKAVLVGYRLGKLGGPTQRDLVRGRLFVPSAEPYSPEQQVEMECVVDESLGVEIGETVEIGGHELKAVGVVRQMMFVFDTPLIFTDARVAQRAMLQDSIYVNTYLVKASSGHDAEEVAAVLSDPQRGLPAVYPVDIHTTEQTVGNILKNYVTEPMRGVQFLRVMLWLTAAILVGMITYVTTMEKTQEIGVMKAIGAANRYVMGLILKQVALMSLLGVGFGLLLTSFAVPAFPIFVLLNPVEAAVVCVLSFVICVVGGYVAARRAARVDPMVAFRGEV